MTRIIVASKEGLDVLQDGQLNKVVLNQPTIIQIGVSQKDIASMEKQGGSLVIHLKNGETIVLENFFNEATNTTEHSLVFPTEQGKFVEAQFDAQGKVIDYRGLNHVTDLAYTSTSPSTATMAVDNDPSFSMGNVLKAGLAVLAAEGLYLWAFDKDDKDDKDDSPSTPDLIAPAAPTATLADDTVTVTGKTEANAKIYIKDAAGNTVASGVADASGNYTIKLDKPLVNGDKLNVIALKGAITAGSETDDARPKLTGSGEANATLTIYDNGVAIGVVTVTSGRSWSFTFDKDLALGKHTITLTQTDAAGLTSEASSPFTFYVVAPKAASLSETSVDTLSTEGPSLADSVGLHTLKAAQSTSTETNNPQKSVPLDDLLKSSRASESDPIAKLLSSTALKTTQASEPIEVNASVGQTTSNPDHPLPDTTSSVLQNLLDQTYPVV